MNEPMYLSEAKVSFKGGVPADSPDLLVEIIMIDGQAPPQAKPELVGGKGTDASVEQDLEIRENTRRSSEQEIDDPGEYLTGKKVPPEGPVNGHSRAKAFRSGAIPVSIMEPDQPHILDVVKDYYEDREQKEILVGPLRLRVDGLEASHKEV